MLLLGAALVGCASGSDESITVGLQLALISYSPMYSAFDGKHAYAVTPSVPSAAPDSKNADPVLASSIRWSVDSAFVKQEEYADIPAAIKLTTKKAGMTTVGVSVRTLKGLSLHSEAKLTISKATQDEWEAGELRYNSDAPATWTGEDGKRICELPDDNELPRTLACANCHSATDSMLSVERTPTQTAGYSDEDFVNIFSQGAKPAGGIFSNPYLRSAAMPDCVYRAFHTGEMTDEEKNGLIWQFRSVAPRGELKVFPPRDLRQL